MAATVPLEHYMRLALRAQCKEEDGTTLFNASPHTQTPTLISNRVNRIILFGGSFNPPHIHHRVMLCHAFLHGGCGLNAIAAFINVADDSRVIAKQEFLSDSTRQVIAKKDRIQILGGSGIHGGWHYFWPYSIDGERKFYHDVQSLALNDGYKIRYVSLRGPEYINQPGRKPKRTEYMCATAETERMNFRDTDAPTGFSQLKGYEEWFEVDDISEQLDHLWSGGEVEWLEQKLDMLFPARLAALKAKSAHECDDAYSGRLREALRTSLQGLGSMRQCYLEEDLNYFVRLIPLRNFEATGGVDVFEGVEEPEISSTRIWEIINSAGEISDAELQQRLQGLALRPDLLLQYLPNRGQTADS